MNPATSEPGTEEVQGALLNKSLLAKVRVIAAGSGEKIADVVSKFGGPGIDREYKRLLAKMQAELTVEGK